MPWIVDGMNLIGSRPDGWWRDRSRARRDLVARLALFAAGAGRGGDETGEPVVSVAFDGRDDAAAVAAGREAGVDVRFAPGGPNAADRLIATMVAALADPQATTVVTSDAALAEEVRAAGAQVMGVRAFTRRLREAGA